MVTVLNTYKRPHFKNPILSYKKLTYYKFLTIKKSSNFSDFDDYCPVLNLNSYERKFCLCMFNILFDFLSVYPVKCFFQY